MQARHGHVLRLAFVLGVLLASGGIAATSQERPALPPAVNRLVERAVLFVRAQHPKWLAEPVQPWLPKPAVQYGWRAALPMSPQAPFALVLYIEQAASTAAAQQFLSKSWMKIPVSMSPLDELKRRGWIDDGFGPSEGKTGTIMFIRGRMVVQINGPPEVSRPLAGHLAQYLFETADAGT